MRFDANNSIACFTRQAAAMFDIDKIAREHFRIHRAALMLTGNPWDADDLAQETFLILSREHGRFANRSSVYTWLYGILLNLDRRHRRQNGLRRHKLQVLWNNAGNLERTACGRSAHRGRRMETKLVGRATARGSTSCPCVAI